jgi:hypothetical protein
MCNTHLILFTVFHMWDSLYLLLTMFHMWPNYVFLHYVFTCESFCGYSLTVFSHVKSLCFVMLISAVHAHSVFIVNTSLHQRGIHWVYCCCFSHYISHVNSLGFTCEKAHFVEVLLSFHTWDSEPLIVTLVSHSILTCELAIWWCKVCRIFYALPMGILCTLCTN